MKVDGESCQLSYGELPKQLQLWLVLRLVLLQDIAMHGVRFNQMITRRNSLRKFLHVHDRY